MVVVGTQVNAMVSFEMLMHTNLVRKSVDNVQKADLLFEERSKFENRVETQPEFVMSLMNYVAHSEKLSRLSYRLTSFSKT